MKNRKEIYIKYKEKMGVTKGNNKDNGLEFTTHQGDYKKFENIKNMEYAHRQLVKNTRTAGSFLPWKNGEVYPVTESEKTAH